MRNVEILAGFLRLPSDRSLISSQLSYVMAGYRYFVCPVEFNNDSNSFQVDCEPSELFQLQDYVLPGVLASATGWVRRSCFLLLLLLGSCKPERTLRFCVFVPAG